jgi:hypothetical protein
MKTIIKLLALAGFAAPAALAMQPPAAGQRAAPAANLPHTVHGELMLFHDVNFDGEAETIETPSTTVHSDWPIRSIAVHPGDSWQICGRARFRSPCIVLNRSVPDARMIGIENQIGSARLAPPPTPAPGN